jgi:DNA-binding transcriptional MerR regulator
MAEGTSELTIDQLAQRTGMSARNIRAHQSRGLLAPPTLRGRTGYYNERHVARIELIQRLQADGFSLALIRRLLRTARDSTEELRRFSEALRGPFGDPQTRVVEFSQLERRFRTTSPEVRTGLERMGLLRRLGNGRVEEVTPLVFRGGEVLADLGAPAEVLLEATAEARRHLDAVAAVCLRLFIDYVWRPFEEAGQPQEGLDGVLETIEQLREVGAGAVGSLFQIAMGDVIEKRVGTELKRLELQRRG